MFQKFDYFILHLLYFMFITKLHTDLHYLLPKITMIPILILKYVDYLINTLKWKPECRIVYLHYIE